MNGIKIKKCKWLKKISNPTQQSHLLSKLQLWLFNYFIIPIKQAFFYVTDSSNYRNRVFYYRKSLWQKIFYKAFKAFKEKSSLKLIPESEVKLLLKYEKSLGIAHLRFLPKTSSCRPIVNMGKNLLFPGITKKIPINKQLLNLLNVLSPDKLKNSDNLGSTVFGTDDVYLKLKHFIQQRKDNQDNRELYFVKTDISNCYDTIKPEKLHDIIKDILQQNPDEYITRRYFTVMSVGGKLRGTINRDSRSLMDYNPDFFSFIKDKIQDGDLRDLLLVDKVISEHDSTDNLLELLRALLYNNIIKVGRLYYKQELGISQGSVLSTLLCNYYYGRMEGESMTVLQDELMMRMVDDFIFISPYKHRAVEFLTNMWSGNVEYNCSVNAEKIVTNFTCQLENRDIQHHINQEFAWCGYIINTSTLNISVDYDRYIGLAISDTMTFETGQNPGQAMKNKLMLSIRPKCNCLFLDPKVSD
ncbi:telomerase reverse transcriptase [Patella vulgata]|uniref:telomerase reverse transcriptase n=1 Tax=Patella vulgata TaxID=6465 RepID=UPI0024A8360B|nr:telomerase reverse transcriptase [Patella vulgata]